MNIEKCIKIIGNYLESGDFTIKDGNLGCKISCNTCKFDTKDHRCTVGDLGVKEINKKLKKEFPEYYI